MLLLLRNVSTTFCCKFCYLSSQSTTPTSLFTIATLVVLDVWKQDLQYAVIS